jgi:hypothetical protein
MKFDVIVSSAPPRPWRPVDEEKLVQDCLRFGRASARSTGVRAFGGERYD